MFSRIEYLFETTFDVQRNIREFSNSISKSIELIRFPNRILQQNGKYLSLNKGIIQSIETSGDGQYAIVQFIGYGNEDSVWVQDLLKSGGEEARQKQTREALGEVVPNGHTETAPEVETQAKGIALVI